MRILAFLISLSLFSSCGETAKAGSSANGAADSPATSTSLENAESPNIRVTVENAPLPGALLIGQFMDQQYKADSSVLDGNTIVFQRDEPYPLGHYFVYFTSGQGFQILIGEDQTFEITADLTDATNTFQVAGNQDNALLYEALRFEESLRPKFQELSSRREAEQKGTPAYESVVEERQALVDSRTEFLEDLYAEAPNSLFTSFKKAGQNPDLREIRNSSGQIDEQAQIADFRYHFWDNVNFNDPRLLRTPVIKNKLNRYIKELTPQNADSLIAAADRLIDKTGYEGKFFEFFANWITLQYEPGKSPVMDAEAIHVNMIQKYFTRERAVWSDSMTVYGLQQRASTMANSLVGDPAPDITVPGLDGKGKRLYDLKKPYIAVFMFNPECDHCIEQSPVLTSLYPSLKNDLDIYAIALDTDADKWKSFVKAYNFDQFTNVFDPTNRSIFKTFYVDNTPELYLVGPDRNIVAKNLNVNQLAEAIRLDKAK